MKKFKKVLLSLTAAAISAASLCIVPSASAEVSGKYNTYGFYFEVPANTNVKTCYANLSYNPNSYEFIMSRTGDLGGAFIVNDIGITDTSKKLYVEYNNLSSSANKGYLGFIALKTNYTSAPFFNITLVKNNSNNTLSTTTVEARRYLMGDANQDGSVTIADATAIMQSMGNPSAYPLSIEGMRAADVNFDGKVSFADVNLIQELDAGLRDGF